MFGQERIEPTQDEGWFAVKEPTSQALLQEGDEGGVVRGRERMLYRFGPELVCGKPGCCLVVEWGDLLRPLGL